MADDHAQFTALLQKLMSPEADVRTPAEEAYDNVPAGTRVPLLLAIMRGGENEMVRTMAAVLLRRVFTSSFEEFWPALQEQQKQELRQQMLKAIQDEPTDLMRRKMAECTAEFARNMIDEEGNNTWPDVLKFMFESVKSEQAGMQEAALHIFSVVPGIFGNSQGNYINVIKEMLAHCLNNTANQKVRFAAVKATVAFLLANESDTPVLNHFRDLLPAIITGVADSVQAQDDDAMLKCLIDLAENVPKFMRGQIENVLTLCSKIIGDSDVSDQWRQLGLEVVVTLSETAPAMVRKFGTKFLPTLVPQILHLMVDLEDEEDWALQDEVEDDDSDSNAIAAESALDRLACALGGKTMLPLIVQNIPPMLSNGDWKYRHAALMALSAAGEGCHKQMEAMLENIVDAALPYLQDPHPRVRYAACNAMGQISTDFGPTFQKKFHAKVVSGLLMVMDDYPHPRVQAHAGAALVNFSEDCPKAILVPYLDPIIAKLDQVLHNRFKELLDKGTKLVLEQTVTTLASVADTSEEKFIQYYDRFMPCLKYIVEHANSPELRMLRGKTIECISLIGLAVGREKFMQDCSAIMELLLKTQTEWEDMPEDDPQISYMISAWARMCKIMGKEFEQYLPLVMGPVLKAAQIKPEVALVDNEDMKVMENDADWQFVTLGDASSFGIRTAGLEEKATACQMLVCYARELKDGFAAYTEEVVKIMVSHLKFYFHDGVRIAAAESLPFLLDCAKIRGPEYLSSMWQFICPPLLSAVSSEPENDIKGEHMAALSQCIEKMGQGCLTEEQLTELVGVLKEILEAHFEKQAKRQEQRKDEDFDEDLEETLIDEDDEDTYILSKVSDIMHALFGVYKTSILPVFEQLLPLFVKLIGHDRPWADKQWGLCIFDDLLEHSGEASFNYQQLFVPALVGYVCDKQGEVRQAAAYGVGVMAQHGGPNYVPALTESIPLLVKVIQDPNSRSVENLNPTENAISAVTKILKHRPEATSLGELLPHWLSWLPTWEDEDEAVHIYGYLCDLVESNNPAILGENNANLPRITAIMAEVFSRQAIAPDTPVGQRMVTLLKHIQGTGEIFQACVAALNQPQKDALHSLLQ